jgi:hypothetical protein
LILRVSSGDVLSSEKRLGLEISLYQILQISSITMLEKVPISRGSSHNCTNYLQLLRKANKLRQHHR